MARRPNDICTTPDGKRITLRELAARLGMSVHKLIRDSDEAKMIIEFRRRQQTLWLTQANGDGRMGISGVPWGYRRIDRRPRP